MFGILAKFFRFSGRENGNKFKLSIVIGLIEALASAMKIPAIMYILIGLLSGKPTGKYIGGSVAIMVLAIVVDVICKRYSTVLQTEGGYNASAFMRIKIAEHLRYLPMGYFNSNSIGEISSITTNTMEILGDVAARVVMLTMQGILETSMIILMLFIFDWRIGLIAAAGVLIFFGVNSVMQNAGKKDSEQKVVCDMELVNQIMEYLQGISEVKSYNLLGKQAKRLNDANEACEKINTKMEMVFVPYHFLQSVITKITGAVIVACRPHRTCFFLCQKNSESFYIAKSYINNEGKSTSVNVRKLGTLKELLIKHGPHTLCSTMPDIPYFRSLFPYH